MALPEFTDAARRLDETDPLASFRNRFQQRADGLLYFDGNSLGMLPERTIGLVGQTVEEEWGDRLIRSWNEGWYELPGKLGDKFASVVGASAGEIVFTDSVTINLLKLASAALLSHKPEGKILTDDLNFPSDLYVLQEWLRSMGKTEQLQVVASEDGLTFPLERWVEAMSEDVALITLSHVAFKSGWRHQLDDLCRAAHERGILVLADLSHSAGAVPIELNRWGVDLAVGCSYKYLNGGPGAPAWLYVRTDLQPRLQPVVAGWFGAQDPFAFSQDYVPAEGIRRFLVGTPPILSLRAIEPGIDLLLEAGMDQVYEKSGKLSSFFIELFDAHLASRGFSLASPRNAEKRGSHLSLIHTSAYGINRALISPANDAPPMIPDFRAPHFLRLGFTPLTQSFCDVLRLVDRTLEILDRGEHQAFPEISETVT